MLSQDGVKVVLGAASVGDAADPAVGFDTPEKAQEFFDMFRAYGGDEIDTARHYPPNVPGTSEPIMGQTNIRDWALISTKVNSAPGEHTTAGIDQSIKQSLDGLKVDSLYINILHHPDPKTDLKETIAAMNAGQRAGHYKHFGLSNYTIKQVREILAICEREGYAKPYAYQGQYNALTRGPELELIPLLREHGIRFYAWSPAAGGMLSSNSKRMTGTDGLSKIFRKFYDRPAVTQAIQTFNEQAEKAGVSGHAAALRWILHHSALNKQYGDAIVVGARNMDQLKSTMEICGDGPLPADLVSAINGIWDVIQEVAPELRAETLLGVK